MKDLVIQFCGDSGDGMQLVGTFFANIASRKGYQVYTNPSYPADMRPPKNSIQGVSSFQVHIGAQVKEPGSEVDIMVCMNPAAYMKCVGNASNRCLFMYDGVPFLDKEEGCDLTYEERMIGANKGNYLYWNVPASIQCNEMKALQSRNIYMLGALCYYLDIDKQMLQDELDKKFHKKENVLEQNSLVLRDVYNVCNNLHIEHISLYESEDKICYEGSYELLSGCDAACKGLMQASKVLGKKLFLGSYPITPASNILINLEKARKQGVIAIQAEDEISACGMALGASCAGAIGVTSTSGPGMCLKEEMINLAVMSEMPLVIIDVQRGGPSTGLPTKTEQSDVNISLYGRSGDSPIPVLAANSPSDCYKKAYEAVKIAVENCTPVILLMDAYIGNALEMTKLDIELPNIEVSSKWVYPGNGEHITLGGSETDETRTISIKKENHIAKIKHREDKIANIVVPNIEVYGEGEELILGFGSALGKLLAVRKASNAPIANLEYLNPLPSNLQDVLSSYKKVYVVEQNNGQLYNYLLSKMKNVNLISQAYPTGEPLDIQQIIEDYGSK